MTTPSVFRSPAGAQAVHQAYQRLLDTHLPSVEQHTVPSSAGDTFVLSAGPADGPPVVMLPGSSSVAGAWAPEITALSRTCRVHAIDLPGESGFSAPTRLPLRPGVHADWLQNVTQHLTGQPATVVGTSLGAWVAMDFAAAHPDSVRELVLFSPSGIGPRRIAPLLLAVLLSAMGERGRRGALRHLLGPRQPAWDDAFHQDLGALALTTFRHFRPRTDPLPAFSDSELRSLPRRLTVVLGTHDRMLDGPGASERLTRLGIPGRIDLLAGQGHLVPQADYLQHLAQPSS